ncbi:MAG: hypothetical protein AVDCRST_MAG25-2437, partial [uncultured Rubrobacteraceae bacterium]
DRGRPLGGSGEDRGLRRRRAPGRGGPRDGAPDPRKPRGAQAGEILRQDDGPARRHRPGGDRRPGGRGEPRYQEGVRLGLLPPDGEPLRRGRARLPRRFRLLSRSARGRRRRRARPASL